MLTTYVRPLTCLKPNSWLGTRYIRSLYTITFISILLDLDANMSAVGFLAYNVSVSAACKAICLLRRTRWFGPCQPHDSTRVLHLSTSPHTR